MVLAFISIAKEVILNCGFLPSIYNAAYVRMYRMILNKYNGFIMGHKPTA